MVGVVTTIWFMSLSENILAMSSSPDEDGQIGGIGNLQSIQDGSFACIIQTNNDDLDGCFRKETIPQVAEYNSHGRRLGAQHNVTSGKKEEGGFGF